MAYDQLEKGYDGDEEETKKFLVYNDGIKDQSPKKTKKSGTEKSPLILAIRNTPQNVVFFRQFHFKS